MYFSPEGEEDIVTGDCLVAGDAQAVVYRLVKNAQNLPLLPQKMTFLATLWVVLGSICRQTCEYVQMYCLVANIMPKPGRIVDFDSVGQSSRPC
jgi:hypothetical protein